MSILYVMDYYNSRIVKIYVEDDDWEDKYNKDVANLLDDYGMNEDECSYMWCDDDLEIDNITHDKTFYDDGW